MRQTGCAAARHWCPWAVLQLELSLRADHAVVVLKLVGELKGSALLRLRVLGERDRRRTVRDGSEAPDDVVRHCTAQRHRAGFGDDEATLVGTTFVGALVVSNWWRGVLAVLSADFSPAFSAFLASTALASSMPPVMATSRLTCPLARMMSVLPDGTVTVPAAAAPARPAASRPARPAACRCSSADSPRRRCGSSRAP